MKSVSIDTWTSLLACCALRSAAYRVPRRPISAAIRPPINASTPREIVITTLSSAMPTP